MSQSEKSQRLFHELSADLTKVRPDVVHSVCCPLCLAVFPIEQIGSLSVEHVVSSKVQGSTKTLTCRQCNNSQGARLDRHLVSGMKAMDGLEGTEPITTYWKRPEGLVVANTLLQAGTKMRQSRHASWGQRAAGSNRGHPRPPPTATDDRFHAQLGLHTRTLLESSHPRRLSRGVLRREIRVRLQQRSTASTERHRRNKPGKSEGDHGSISERGTAS